MKSKLQTRSLPKNAVRAENKILLSCDRRGEPSCCPPVVYNSGCALCWITYNPTTLGNHVEFWEAFLLSLLSPPPVLISFFPQPALHSSLKCKRKSEYPCGAKAYCECHAVLKHTRTILYGRMMLTMRDNWLISFTFSKGSANCSFP